MSPERQANALERAVSLPTGLVTLLLADIEGSTQRWERYGDAMRLAVERHDEVMRREVETHRGYVFKTVGEAFCAAFESAASFRLTFANRLRLLAERLGGTRQREGIT